MPSFAPRTETIKKVEELQKRKQELVFAVQQNVQPSRLTKAIEKYRKAQLSLLKAKAHVYRDKEFANRVNNYNFSKIENEMAEWTGKSGEAILSVIIEEISSNPEM